ISGDAIFPGAGYVDLCLTFAEEHISVQDGNCVQLSNGNVLRTLKIYTEINIQLTSTKMQSATWENLYIQSRGAEEKWQLNFTATLDLVDTSEIPIITTPFVAGDIPQWVSRDNFYEQYGSCRRGVHYGPKFHSMVAAQQISSSEILATVHTSEDTMMWTCHPAVLDGAFQTASHVVYHFAEQEDVIPFHLSNTYKVATVGNICNMIAKANAEYSASMWLYPPNNNGCAIILKGFTMRPMLQGL
ncbi:MAG: hypothetical protein GY737_29555, partial [Desulfobacteraceae bacterium]|nr:hypothetical protein [Desulfobacteraceae bacterium]